jgi:hypothetical protein
MSFLSVIPLKTAMVKVGFKLSEGEGFLTHEFQLARDYLASVGLSHIGDEFHTFEAEAAKGGHDLATGIKNLVKRVEFDVAGKPVQDSVTVNNSPLLVTNPTPGHTADTITIPALHAAQASAPTAIVAQTEIQKLEAEAKAEAEKVAAAVKAEADKVEAEAKAEAEKAAAAAEAEAKKVADDAKAKADAEAKRVAEEAEAAAEKLKADAAAKVETEAAATKQTALDTEAKDIAESEASADETDAAAASSTETKE